MISTTCVISIDAIGVDRLMPRQPLRHQLPQPLRDRNAIALSGLVFHDGVHRGVEVRVLKRDAGRLVPHLHQLQPFVFI
jgi:hypothetical protein